MKTFRNSTLKENLQRLSENSINESIQPTDVITTVTVADLLQFLKSDEEQPYDWQALENAYFDAYDNAGASIRMYVDKHRDEILKYANNQ